MTIDRFYTQTFTVSRLTYTGYKGAYATIGTIKGHLQQKVQEEGLSQMNQPNLQYTVWCDPSSNVKENDILIDGARQYTVIAIQENDFVGKNKHLELLVNRSDIISA